MGQAHSLDRLSSERKKPEASSNGPALLLENLSTTWERARFSNDMIQFMLVESWAIRIFGSECESMLVMEKMWRDLAILWSDKDNMVGRPKA